MEIKFREFKIHTVLAIVAALLVPYLFEPILNLLGKAFIYIGNSIASKYLDSLYRDIAAGKSDYFLLFSSGILCVIGILFFILSFKILFKKNRKGLSIQENETLKIQKNIATNEEKHETKQIKPFLRFITCLVYFIFSLYTFGIIISGNIKYSTITSFEQKIKILAPYISANEKDLLLSKFSSMNSYHDYLALAEEIKVLAKSKNIKLPKQSYMSLY